MAQSTNSRNCEGSFCFVASMSSDYNAILYNSDFDLLTYYICHFLLNQVLCSASDGRRYIYFYNVVAYPYLAIVDPRTGECMRTYNNITVDSLISDLNDMLSTHASPESASQVTSNSKNWNNFPTTPPKRNILADQIKNVSY